MKNKVTVIALALILTLSSTSVLAADRVNFTNFNIYDMLRNYGFYNYEPVNDNRTENTLVNSRVETPVDENITTTTEDTNRTAAPTSVSNYEQRVAELVNVERQKNGLAPLTLDSAISNVARMKSKDMSDNNYFAHQSPTYGSAGDMLTQFGIRWSAWGENIASGQRTPEEVVNAWMNSEGHRANILSPNFSKIGVGYVNDGRPYWTQMFTN
ncbi:MAG TPA: hypothetical protein GX396_06105 [Tissierellia bacterium]|nr:hypothetical protein [Tissierellia bacterium]